MPELPEITVIAGQMREEIVGKRVAGIEARQPKSLNMPVSEFKKIVKGKEISDVSSRGKWIFTRLEQSHYLLVNLGMGAELLYFAKGRKLPDNYHFRLDFSNGSGFTAHFWWFGYVHLISEERLAEHKMTAQLGKAPLDRTFTLKHFEKSLEGKKGGIKSFLLDQKNLAGIGNVYVQDILFRARLHPNRKISTLSKDETASLHYAMRNILSHSVRLGGAAFEVDFYGRRGRFTADNFSVGYKPGKPCPECGTLVEKIRTGATSSYICPRCQRLE